MATINMHMKFEIEIPKETWLMLRKPCRLQTDGQTDRRTDGRTDGRTDKVIPVYPPSNFVGRGYKNTEALYHWPLLRGIHQVTIEFPSQRASDTESVSMAWHPHDNICFSRFVDVFVLLSRTLETHQDNGEHNFEVYI